MTTHDDARTLQRLVLDCKGERSYERLARDCGGIPTGKRLQQIATSPELKTFPDPPTIRGLAQGLGVSQTEVVLASARSLGLGVSAGGDGSQLVLNVGELPAAARQAVIAVVRQMSAMGRELEQLRGDASTGATVGTDLYDLDLAAREPRIRKRRDEVQHLDE